MICRFPLCLLCAASLLYRWLAQEIIDHYLLFHFLWELIRSKKKCHYGEVPEWLNGTVSKTVVWATVPRVRIPPSPQDQNNSAS